jgi:exopolysaccharide biosynthesis polyprenyl glycosylphosphotransferase
MNRYALSPAASHRTRRSDDPVRNELVQRYAAIGPVTLRSRVRFQLKRLAWISVIRGARLVKRVLDVAGAIALLVVLAPLLLLIAVAIRVESSGPVLFTQTRVGKWGRLFTLYKFRSMYVDAEKRREELARLNEMQGGVTFKMKQDPRVTRIGRFIRRGSIDELPQLWNVLRGDMSLVGPRPPLPSEVAGYTIADRRRLEVKPGITCIWQVSGRSTLPFWRQVELDVAYIESQSFGGDLKILLRTIPAVLLGRGAY